VVGGDALRLEDIRRTSSPTAAMRRTARAKKEEQHLIDPTSSEHSELLRYPPLDSFPTKPFPRTQDRTKTFEHYDM